MQMNPLDYDKDGTLQGDIVSTLNGGLRDYMKPCKKVTLRDATDPTIPRNLREEMRTAWRKYEFSEEATVTYLSYEEDIEKIGDFWNELFPISLTNSKKIYEYARYAKKEDVRLIVFEGRDIIGAEEGMFDLVFAYGRVMGLIDIMKGVYNDAYNGDAKSRTLLIDFLHNEGNTSNDKISLNIVLGGLDREHEREIEIDAEVCDDND